MTHGTEIYLIIHGVTTIGALLGFLLTNERRLTKLETTLKLFYDEHIRITRKTDYKDTKHHV